MKKKLLIALAAVVMTVLVTLILATPKIDEEPPLPNPNGYDDFLKAVALLEPNPPDWQSAQGEEQHEVLKTLVATNGAALELVQAALKKECRVPPWTSNPNGCPHIDDLAGAKRIAQSFMAASRLALVEGRTNEAAALAVDCIRYGNEACRGGVLIDGLVGIAIKSIGLATLQPALPGMDLANTRKAVSELDTVLARSEPGEDFIKRHRQWARRGRFGPVGIVEQFVQTFLNRNALSKSCKKFTKVQTDIARMKLQLAARTYELEQGKPPAAAQDLVPKYLKSVPIDTDTGKEMPLK